MNRPSILDPAGPIRVERYSLAFTRLPDAGDGVVRFEAIPQIIFRPERLLCAAGLPLSRFHAFILRFFGWIRYLWFRIEKYEPIDEMTEEEIDAAIERDEDLDRVERRLKFYWRRPFAEAVHRSQARAQRKVLAGCVVRSIKTDNCELLVGPAPLEMFNPTAIAMRFDAPTMREGQSIRIETSPTTAPLTFSMIGFGKSS
jgi:hypothetical protein